MKEFQDEPRSIAIAKRGIKTSDDYSHLMSALMSDVMLGKVSPGDANKLIEETPMPEVEGMNNN